MKPTAQSMKTKQYGKTENRWKGFPGVLWALMVLCGLFWVFGESEEVEEVFWGDEEVAGMIPLFESLNYFDIINIKKSRILIAD